MTTTTTRDSRRPAPPRKDDPCAESHRYLCDMSEWPLVVISAPPGCNPDRLDPDSFYAHTDRLLDHGQPFALLYDVRNSGRLSAERRKRFVDYVERRRKEVDSNLIAYASLVATDWQRGLLTAVLWFLTPPRPHSAFSAETDARKWLMEMLQEAGILRTG